MAPTLGDVARLAGVHKATASRALNPATRDLVRAETARRVVSAARDLGYTPNQLARGLRTAKSATVGVLVPDLMNPLFPPIVRGIDDVLGPVGLTALVASTDNDDAKERHALAALRGRRVDGLIVATAQRTHPVLDEIVREGMPLVLVNRMMDRRDVFAVAADEAGGIEAAVGHLAGLGHTAIAHLSGPAHLSTGTIRRRAFEHAVRASGAVPDSPRVIECASYSEAAGADATRRLLRVAPGVSAVVAANDLIALGALTALGQAGRRCPDDVSVVGFNDMPFLDKITPPLTTLRIPQYQLGAEAAQMLLQRLREPGASPRTLLLPTQLVVRGSTAAPPPATRG